ncbi:MAG: hypothetical protein HC861_07295 [Rhodospirillaceae bacterium]|nr:hypothetical protein [Rhodospirillaceae bacterium]
MTKAELVEEVSAVSDLTKKHSEIVVNTVFKAIITALHKDRPLNEPWTVAISAAQANAWINVKLPRWLINRRLGWPERLAEAQVEFSGGQVSLGARSRLDISLPVGSVGEMVTVTGVSPLLSTESAALGTVVNSNEVSKLPLAIRNWDDLLAMVSGDHVDMIGLTVSCDIHIAALAPLVASLRAASRNNLVAVMVGGRVINDHPELALRARADGTAVTGGEAVVKAEMLVEMLSDNRLRCV